MTQAEMDERYQGVMDAFSKEIDTGQVIVHRAISPEVADEIGEVDFVYIDGDHTYEGVKSDLETWWPHLVPGGMIGGDDYNIDSWWKDGVVRAIGEWCARPDVIVEWKQHKQIILKKIHLGKGK